MSAPRTVPWVSLLLGSLALGCGSPATGKAKGESCRRSVECGPGLACVEQVCSDDLGPLQGSVPQSGGMDAGVMPPVDGGGGGADGAAPDDSGSGPMDAGGGGSDAGGGMDAGDPDPEDAGRDAGGEPMDAAPDAADARVADGGDGGV